MASTDMSDTSCNNSGLKGDAAPKFFEDLKEDAAPFFIIGLHGKKGAGKSTVASHLCSKYGFTEFAFANALKDASIDIFGLQPEQVYGTQADKEKPDDYWKISPRVMLQEIGSAIRNIAHPAFKHIWIRRLERAILDSKKKLIVMSDVRYPDEAQFVEDFGARAKATTIIIHVIRDTSEPTNAADTHESENQAIAADYILMNDGDLQQLFAGCDSIIQSYN